jgi:diaminopimelate epimerase
VIRFVKGHGTQNDFVLLPDPERALDLTPDLVRALTDRRAGVGGDGVLRVVLAAVDPEGAPMSDQARWFMDYRNADGSVAEMCGNGIRVFARLLARDGLETATEFGIATRDGVKTVRLEDDGQVTVDMGPARLSPTARTVSTGGRSWPAVEVDVGNPHAVAFVDDLAAVGDLASAPRVEPAFAAGVNVEFVVRRGPRHLALRVHERGVGETRSCGTGACAAMAAAAAADRPDQGEPVSAYVVDVPGGRLTVTCRPDGHLELTGPAVLVAEGELASGWWESRVPAPVSP